MWTLSDTTIWFQTISSTLLGTKMLKSRAQNLLIVANSCFQIFIIIIAVLITHFAYASMRFGFSAEVNFAQNIISPLRKHRREKLLIKLLLIKDTTK